MVHYGTEYFVWVLLIHISTHYDLICKFNGPQNLWREFLGFFFGVF